MPPKTKSRKPAYACSECGYATVKWVGRCPECQAWGTLVEEATKGVSFVPSAAKPTTKARPITELNAETVMRYPTGIGELDRVFGGGIVPGAAILLSGEPGVGKSTLLIESASKFARTGARVLYISGEESTNQVRMRAERTNALEPTLYLASETDLATILGHIEELDPSLVIVDSVQTVASADVESLAGQPSQVRAVSAALVRVAKEREVPIIMVGHVTKDGNVAGPRLLEHLVDVVAHVEGDRQTALRFVRTLKNRFGPTDEVGCFEMTGDGMTEVPDPSELFVSQRDEPVAGSCVTVAMEGRRPLLVEIQALVVKTGAPNPRRVVSGVDHNRVAMLLAVLERRCNINMSQFDVYVSTGGGVRLTEPSTDLAIAMAVASAVKDAPVRGRSVVFGEVSLVGDIRSVTNEQQRVTEASRLGFRTTFGPNCGRVYTALVDAGVVGSRS